MLTSAVPPPVERYVYLEALATAEDILSAWFTRDIVHEDSFVPCFFLAPRDSFLLLQPRWLDSPVVFNLFQTKLSIVLTRFFLPPLFFSSSSPLLLRLLVLFLTLLFFFLFSSSSSSSTSGVSEPTSALLVVRDPSSFVWRAGGSMASSKWRSHACALDHWPPPGTRGDDSSSRSFLRSSRGTTSGRPPPLL